MPTSDPSDYISRDDETEASLVAQPSMNGPIFDIEEIRQYNLQEYGIGFPPVEGSDYR